jgi:small GTP-binding protein
MADENEDENVNNILDAKVVFLGETGVGKTSLIRQYINHAFDESCNSSISSQFCSKTVNIPKVKKLIRFDIWDTAGQEKFRSLARIFYRDAQIIIFVYDITTRLTFEAIQQYWYEEVKANCTNKAVLAVVANKYDLYSEKKVEDKEAIEWADKIGAIFQWTSAKSNKGINLLFENTGRKFLNPKFNYKKEDDQDRLLYEKKKLTTKENNKNDDEEDNTDIKIPETQSVKLKKNPPKQKTKKCC